MCKREAFCLPTDNLCTYHIAGQLLCAWVKPSPVSLYAPHLSRASWCRVAKGASCSLISFVCASCLTTNVYLWFKVTDLLSTSEHMFGYESDNFTVFMYKENDVP